MFNPDVVGTPNIYIGTKLKLMKLKNCVRAWEICPSKLLRKLVKNCKEYVFKYYNIPDLSWYLTLSTKSNWHWNESPAAIISPCLNKWDDMDASLHTVIYLGINKTSYLFGHNQSRHWWQIVLLDHWKAAYDKVKEPIPPNALLPSIKPVIGMVVDYTHTEDISKPFIH